MRYLPPQPNRARGVITVAVAICLIALIGFTALAVDAGMILLARVELQRAADACALAAIEELEYDFAGTGYNNADAALVQAKQFATLNPVLGEKLGLNSTTDVQFGYFNLDAGTFKPGTTPANAVLVKAGRTKNSVSGPISLNFMPALGRDTADVYATALAVMDDRVGRITPPFGGLLPFVIRDDLYADQVANGPDRWTFDGSTGSPVETTDGVPEVTLFPNKIKADGTTDGAGNYGLLNIGVENAGVSDLNVQIENGVTSEELALETGSSELDFVDDSGNPRTYEITGTPGISGGISFALETRLGQVVSFFTFSTVAESGSNATYTINSIRFARVMEVDLTGKAKGFILQPVVYDGPGVETDPNAPSTNGMITRTVLLVR